MKTFWFDIFPTHFTHTIQFPARNGCGIVFTWCLAQEATSLWGNRAKKSTANTEILLICSYFLRRFGICIDIHALFLGILRGKNVNIVELQTNNWISYRKMNFHRKISKNEANVCISKSNVIDVSFNSKIRIENSCRIQTPPDPTGQFLSISLNNSLNLKLFRNFKFDSNPLNSSKDEFQATNVFRGNHSQPKANSA